MANYSTIRIILGYLILSLSILAISAPILQSILGYPTGESIYSFLSPICHQFPTRSFWIMNRPFALCSRCFGGYLGLALGLMIIKNTTNYKKSALLGIAILFPGVFDGVFQLYTKYESTNILRFITGLSGGVGMFLIFLSYNSNTNKSKGIEE